MSELAFDITIETIHRLINERDELRKELDELYPFEVRDSIESIGDEPIVVAKLTDWVYVNDMLDQSDSRVKQLENENEWLRRHLDLSEEREWRLYDAIKSIVDMDPMVVGWKAKQVARAVLDELAGGRGDE